MSMTLGDPYLLRHAWEEATEELDKLAEDYDFDTGETVVFHKDYVAGILLKYAALSDAVRHYLGIKTSYSTLDLAN